MTVELEYDESTGRSTMLGVAELEMHTVKMTTWNRESLTGTTDMATVGGANYVNESTATMRDYGEDIDTIDFGMLVVDELVVDDDEEELGDTKCARVLSCCEWWCGLLALARKYIR